MKRETAEKASEIIKKLDKQETILKILESPKYKFEFILKNYQDPNNYCVRRNDIPFQFEDEEIAMLIEHKKKEIEKLKRELENL